MKYILLLLFLACGRAETQAYPMSDTAKGVVVYYDDDLKVKADSAVLIRKADRTVCKELGLIDCGISFGHRCQPHWYEWRIIKKDKWVVAVRQKISFHPDPIVKH